MLQIYHGNMLLMENKHSKCFIVRQSKYPVDQPERTVHYDSAMCIAEMLHNTRL